MLYKIKNVARQVFRKMGYEIETRPKDMKEPDFVAIYELCRPYTMTSMASMHALYQAAKYVTAAKIPGDIIECGVWRAGSAMLMAHTLQRLGETSRKIYLYDTFKGMTEPSEKDILIANDSPAQWKGEYSVCCTLEQVKRNMSSTGYPEGNLIYVEGRVEDTIPKTIPSKIAILRLDTDWYESTYHELRHLYPLLSNKGVLAIDDYGHWKGVREAVDRYFREEKISLFLHRIDYSGRIAVK